MVFNRCVNTIRYWPLVAISAALSSTIVSGCAEDRLPENRHVVVVKPAELATTTELVFAALPTESSRTPRAPQLIDRHVEANVHFVFDTGANGRALMIESIGGGGGWLDFDRDNRWDLYLVQGGDPFAPVPHPQGDRLLRNVTGETFRDVTDASRRPDGEYGQGLAVGDFDNDGFDDLYVTNVGGNRLLQNLGDGTFLDVTATAGVDDARWSTSAAWSDLDRDGDLDLFVCNYVEYDIGDPVICQHADGTPAICHPDNIAAQDNNCFENLGNGQFRSMLSAWGLAANDGKSLGVAIADFNLDGRPDLLVANDITPNHLFIQQPQGTFVEQGVPLGIAMSGLGQYQASMGVAVADYDRNGFPDVYLTHFTHDSNTLYKNLGPAGFQDATRLEQLHQPTVDQLGFGTVMTDLNADGRMDLFVTNGHIDDWRSKGDRWKMPAQLFSRGTDHWFDQSSSAGPFFTEHHLGRAVGRCDYDEDGDADLLVVHQLEEAALLQNVVREGHWLTVDLVGRLSNRRGVGARVDVRCGEVHLTEQIAGGTSFCTTHQPRLFFGLGSAAGDCDITVHWPHSQSVVQSFSRPVDQRLLIEEPIDEKSTGH